MIHRPNKIVADLDDRLIKPDAARSSLNLRFAASISDTDLGITLINGLAEITYAIPDGDNKCIGAKEDFESQAVYFALWNSNDEHGIYQIKSDTIVRVIGGSILNFDENSEVDLRAIDGKLYWTDDVNQPRMVNIAKGIAGLYPSPLEEWMITQIKRRPGLPLEVAVDRGSGYVPTDFLLSEASVDYDDEFPNANGFQFTYYYVYDNDEESRLAPVSIVDWWTTMLRVRIPAPEFDAYLDNINLVKQVVFCFRIGNDGIWYEAKRVENISGNYVDGTIQYLISDIAFLPKSAVSSDITDADFDSVPLLAPTLEIAQNRLDLANYLIDYPNWAGLTLDLVVEQVVTTGAENTQWRTFKPGGVYTVGIQLFDEWGRKIGVVAAQTVTIPNPVHTYWDYATQGPPVDSTNYPPEFTNDAENLFQINFTISGTFPDWARYYEVVYSRALNYTYFNKSVCKVLYWYFRNGVNEFSFYAKQNNIVPVPDTDANFVFKGFAIELSSGEPFLFTSGKKQFATIWNGYLDVGVLTPSVSTWEIDGAYGNLLLIKAAATDPLIPLPVDIKTLTGAGFPSIYAPFFYEVDLWQQSDSPSEIYWQSTDVQNELSILTGSVYGDSYINAFSKINNGNSMTVFRAVRGLITDPWFVLSSVPTLVYNTATYTCFGYFISINPTNIYSQIWTSDIGQANVVNENQRQKRILNGIIFSNPLIQGTQINGLSKFNSVDNRQAPLENGPITALVRTNATQREPGVLLAIGTSGVSSFYYDGIQLTNVDGTSNVSTSDRYLASQRPLVGNYGAERLSNICVTPLGTVYYWSENIKDWIRYTNAGLDQLGETYEFMNFLRNQLQSSDEIMVTYDQVTDEAIIIGNNSNAAVFSERYKSFQGSREYNQGEEGIKPERGATLAIRTYLFLQGHVWQMGPGVSAPNNSFFGELKNPQVTIVTNVEPTVVKRWDSARMFGPRPLTTQMNGELPDGAESGRQTYIEPGWWIERKWNFDAAIRCDENSVGGVLNGSVMESRILISTFAWDAATFDKLNYIEIRATRSPTQ
jgi:hypothetical protein